MWRLDFEERMYDGTAGMRGSVGLYFMVALICSFKRYIELCYDTYAWRRRFSGKTRSVQATSQMRDR